MLYLIKQVQNQWSMSKECIVHNIYIFELLVSKTTNEIVSHGATEFDTVQYYQMTASHPHHKHAVDGNEIWERNYKYVTV